MSEWEAVVLMGPPGCGKSYLGNRLKQQGMASYVEIEPLLVERFGTGQEFARNKARALAFLRQCVHEQLAERVGVVAFESTGLSDRPLLEEIQRSHRVALIKLMTPKSTCLERIGARAAGRNLSNDVAASERFWDYWHREIAPGYNFDLEIDGEDAGTASEVIRRFLQT